MCRGGMIMIYAYLDATSVYAVQSRKLKPAGIPDLGTHEMLH